MRAVLESGPDTPKGLYEQLVSREIARILNDLRARGFVADEEELDTADSHEVLARYVYEVLRRVLSEIPFENRIERQVAFCNHVVTVLAEAGSLVNEPTSRLLAILDGGATPTGEVRRVHRPHVPLSASGLLVSAR